MKALLNKLNVVVCVVAVVAMVASGCTSISNLSDGNVVDADLGSGAAESFGNDPEASGSPESSDDSGVAADDPKAGEISIDSSVPTVANDWGESAVVERVIDGDSLELSVDGAKVEVRLPGFNAPELYGEANAKTCQGTEAAQALERAVSQGDVRFQAEAQDRYGRTLGQLAVNGRLVIERLIGEGWGLATGGDASGDEDLERAAMQRDLMKGAAESRLGIWGDRCGEPTSTDLLISNTHVDAEGNDRSNLNDEWVEIGNDGTETVDLSRWVIRDETFGHRFLLRGLLGPGDTLRVRSGDGDNSSREMFLGERYPVWSNSDETVVLVDPNGVFVHWLFVD